MSFVIERHGWFHSPGGWRTSEANASRYETEAEAQRDANELLATTLAGLAGEVKVREARS